MRVAYRIAGENGVFDRPGGLAGIWGTLIRQVHAALDCVVCLWSRVLCALVWVGVWRCDL